MPRSTRNKLKWQVEKSMGCVDRATEHLARLDLIAGEQSDYINKHVPRLVVMLEAAKTIFSEFREGL